MIKITKKKVLFFIGYAVLYGVIFFIIGEAINWLTDNPDIPWTRNVIQGIFFGILMAIYHSWVNSRKEKASNKKD